MALLSTLVERIADIEGVDRTYASGVARYLREAGLLTQAGRGRGAAHMSTTDASRFLIGLNASAIAKDAPDYTRSFEELRMVWDTKTKIPGICENDQCLLSAINKLIDLCGDAQLRSKFLSEDLEIFIDFNRPVAHVYIRMQETTWDEYGVPDTSRIAYGLYGSPLALAKTGTPDRRETVTISQRTLLVAAEVLSS